MQIRRKQKPDSGLTRLEVVAILVALAFLLLPALNRIASDKSPAYRVICTSSLKQVSLGLLLWSEDQRGRFSFQVSTNEGGSLEYGGVSNTFRHFQMASNQIHSPKVLVCPADKERVKAQRNDPLWKAKSASDLARMWLSLNNGQVSYFVNLDAEKSKPQSVLVGDGNVSNRGFDRQQYLLASSNNPPQWSRAQHHWPYLNSPEGNVAFADGSVLQASDDMLPRYFRHVIGTTNRLAVP